MADHSTEFAEQDRRVTAYHEAAHAAMHWFFQTPDELLGIEMQEGDRHLAQVNQYLEGQLLTMAEEKNRHPRRARSIASMLIMKYLAGKCAETIVGEPDEAWLESAVNEQYFTDVIEADKDISQALHAHRLLFGLSHPDCRWGFLQQRGRWVEEALKNSGLWDVVEALAPTLLQGGIFSGREVWQIMADAWGQKRPLPLQTQPWKRRFSHLPHGKIGSISVP